MWFRHSEKKTKTKTHTDEGRDFFEAMSQGPRDIELKTKRKVLDLRPEDEQTPKAVYHYHEQSETFYDMVPTAAPYPGRTIEPRFPKVYSPVRQETVNRFEVIAVAVVLVALMLAGLGLFYVSVR
jgi:hypothetical protein